MNILGLLFKPNRYSILGMLLLIIGFFLIPFLVGFFIMPIGALLLVFGIHLSIYRLIPGHKRLTQRIIQAYRPYFRKKSLPK